MCAVYCVYLHVTFIFSLLFHPVSSFLFHLLLSCLVSPPSSSLVLSCLSFSHCLSLCDVCRCGRGVVWWSWCVFVCLCVLRHAEKTWENPCVGSKTPPCVHSKRPRVCRHHAHICFNMVPVQHEDVLNLHTEGVLYIHTGGQEVASSACQEKLT